MITGRVLLAGQGLPEEILAGVMGPAAGPGLPGLGGPLLPPSKESQQAVFLFFFISATSCICFMKEAENKGKKNQPSGSASIKRYIIPSLKKKKDAPAQ